MAKLANPELSLRVIDPTVNTVVESVVNVDGFSHSTQLPGGFWTCSFFKNMSEADMFEWLNNRLLFRLLVNSGGVVLWEGRLQRIAIVGQWRLKMTFFGYYANFTDAAVTLDAGELNTTGDVILSNILGKFAADTLQLSTATDLFEPAANLPTLDIAEFVGKKVSAWDLIIDGANGLLRFGDNNDNKMDLAVYEDRKVTYSARSPTKVDWTCPLRFTSLFPPIIDWKTVANDIDITRLGGTTLGSVEDTDSIARWIRRMRVLPDIGSSDIASGTKQRDTELAFRKNPQQQTDSITVTHVFDDNGQERSICEVRSGEVIQIPDFLPSTPSPTLDGIRTFLIVATTCDHDRGQLTIRPDSDSRRLSAVLGRGNIR